MGMEGGGVVLLTQKVVPMMSHTCTLVFPAPCSWPRGPWSAVRGREIRGQSPALPGGAMTVAGRLVLHWLP